MRASASASALLLYSLFMSTWADTLLQTVKTSGWSQPCNGIRSKSSVTSLFACRSIVRMTAVLKRTTSSSLQLQLERWVALVDTAISLTNPSVERSDAILAFCKVFVPADVSEDDIDHFCGMLTTDEVIESLCQQKNDYVLSILVTSRQEQTWQLLHPRSTHHLQYWLCSFLNYSSDTVRYWNQTHWRAVVIH